MARVSEPKKKKEKWLQDCEASSSCNYYTYYPDDSFCVLFSTCELEPCDDCITGQPGC